MSDISIAPFQFSGLASGIDWKTMVDRLMEIERRPIDLLQMEQNKIGQQLTAWQGIGGALFALGGALDALKAPDAFSKLAAVSGSESVLKVSAGTGAQAGSYSVVVNSLAAAHTVASDVQPAGPLNLSGTFSVNGKQVTVTTTDTLQDVANKISSAGAGVYSYVVDNRLVVKSASAGTANAIQMADVSGNVLQALGVLDISGAFKNVLQAPQDATFTVDGLAVTRSSNTVSDVIPGVTLYLQGTGNATVNVTLDAKTVAGEVKAVIDGYNSVMDKLSAALAKGAILQGDTGAVDLQITLRRTVSDFADKLKAAGMTIDASGKIVVDDSALQGAISSNVSSVRSLFFNAGNGLGDRLEDIVQTWGGARGVIGSTEDSLNRISNDIQERIKVMEVSLDLRRQVLTEEFIAMENAIVQLQGQVSYLNRLNG